MENLIRKNILNLTPYSSAREEYTGKEGVFLDANENPFGIYNRYPDPYQVALKRRLSEIKNITSDHIFIGNGSDEVIDIAFRIFCKPSKDKALTFTPTYGMYEISARINDIELIKLPLTSNFQIDCDAIRPYFLDLDLKLIFICSPNNPTANLIAVKDIEFILQHFKGMIVIDEAYIDFCEQASFLERINQYPNLIVSQTMSKAWGLAGIRLGIAYMNEVVLSYYNKVKAPYNISIVSQNIALETLNNLEEYKRNLKVILEEKSKLINELSTIKSVRKIYPSDTNFLFIEVDNVQEIYSQLIEKQVIVRNRNSVIQNCLRITVGTREENQKLIEQLQTLK